MLRKKFQLGDQGLLEWFLAVLYDYDQKRGTVTASQVKYVHSILKKYCFDGKGVKTADTPMEEGL
eukprot:2594034-Rhodomonas_salina.1